MYYLRFYITENASVMSCLLTLTSRTNIFSYEPPTPLTLNPQKNYQLAFLYFYSYNTIPNIETGQKFSYYENNNRSQLKEIEFPAGCYEISDIERFIKRHISNPNSFYLRPNNNTLKCEIFSREHAIDFQLNNNLGEVLGFSNRVLEPNILHCSDLPVNIIKVRTIHFDCNITTGSFYRDRPAHTIYEFSINVDPGFAIDETPKNIIYLPIISQREITNITVQALDQNFRPINFRGEESILGLELKEV